MSDARTVEADPPWEGLRDHDLYAVCLERAREGDRRALDRLVTELTPLVWTVARGNGLERHAVEDVVQSVWLTLCKNLGRVKDPRALAAWLITTTRRESQRAGARRPAPVPLTEELEQTVFSTQPAPEDEAVRADRDRRLWAAFRELPDRCQEILRLTVLAGRAEYRFVAEALHMPHGSIGPTRGRCLQQLRTRLDDRGGGA